MTRKSKRRLRSCVSAFLVITTFIQSLYITPMTAHADPMGISIPELSTPPNAHLAAPLSLEIPDVTPSVAMSGMTAAQWAWRALFSLFGVAVKDTEGLDALSTDVTSYIQASYEQDAKVVKVLANLTKIGWGEILHGCPELKKAIGEYFASKEGFGAGSGLTSVQVPNTDYISYSDSYCSSFGINPGDYGIDSSNYLLSCYDTYTYHYVILRDYFVPVEYANDNYRLLAVSGDSSASNSYVTMYAYDVVNDTVEGIGLDCLSVRVENDIPLVSKFVVNPSCGASGMAVGRYKNWDEVVMAFPFPFLKAKWLSVDDILKWVHTPNIYATFNGWPIGINGEIWDGVDTRFIWVDVQSDVTIQKESANIMVGEDLTLPTDEQTGTEALESISTAMDIDALAKAMANYMTVTHQKPDVSGAEYNDMVHIINSIANYCGVSTLTNDDINKFIIQLSGVSQPDNAEERAEIAKIWAAVMLSQYVQVSPENESPDPDNNKKFNVLKPFAVSLLSFLLSIGFSSEIADFDNEPSFNNVKVLNEFPDPGNDKPDEKPNDSVVQSLLDILSYLKEILKTLLNLSLLEDILNYIDLLPNKLVEGFALPDLFDSLFTVVGNIPSQMVKALNLEGLFSGIKLSIEALGNKLFSIMELIIALPESFKVVEPSNPDDTVDENNSSFRNFIAYIACLVYIILLLIMIFANCIRLIILIFNIPPNTSLFNEDMLLGLEYTKNLMIPQLNVSLFSLLTGIAFFLCVMSIIPVLKKRIDKLHE